MSSSHPIDALAARRQVRVLATWTRTAIYALAVYGGSSLAVDLWAQTTPAARAYMPFATGAQGVAQADLDARLKAIEQILAGVSRQGDTIVVSGANLQIISGAGKTDAAPNGKGNLVIGYNELRGGTDLEGNPLDTRSGSHMLVIGKGLNYSRFGGIVAGQFNSVTGEWSSAVGGRQNEVSGDLAIIAGGAENRATGIGSAAFGGGQNRVSGWWSGAIGGSENVVLGDTGASLGGWKNVVGADAEWSTVTGGQGNRVEGSTSSISGGGGVIIDAGRGNAWAAGNLASP